MWGPRLGAADLVGAGAEPGPASLPCGTQAAARAAAQPHPSCHAPFPGRHVPSASPPGITKGGGRGAACGHGDAGDGDGDGRSASCARPRLLAYPSRDHAVGNPQFYAASVNYHAHLMDVPTSAAAASRCEGGWCSRTGQATTLDSTSDLRLPTASQIIQLRLHSLRRSGPAAAD